MTSAFLVACTLAAAIGGGAAKDAGVPVGCEPVAAALADHLAPEGKPFEGTSAARVVDAMTPACREAIDAGRWPALAAALLAGARGQYNRHALCLLMPPEAVPHLADDLRFSRARQLDCGTMGTCAARLRVLGSPAARAAVAAMNPFVQTDGWEVACEVIHMAHALPASLRDELAPLLDEATRRRASGRDSLHRALCAGRSATSAPLASCEAPASLESRWAALRRLRGAMKAIVPFIVVALVHAIAAIVLWRRGMTDRRAWAAMAAVSGFLAAVPLAGLALIGFAEGATVGVWFAIMAVAAPLAGAAGAFVGWAMVRWGDGPPLAVCLGLDGLFAAGALLLAYLF